MAPLFSENYVLAVIGKNYLGSRANALIEMRAYILAL